MTKVHAGQAIFSLAHKYRPIDRVFKPQCIELTSNVPHSMYNKYLQLEIGQGIRLLIKKIGQKSTYLIKNLSHIKKTCQMATSYVFSCKQVDTLGFVFAK